ncbi:class I SAM-dependent methyltransferase [Gammaproteobacteria bacterium]|nr:class I SAM-dependent methyltransferase [Gammaproteobacteria bacterium]MDA8926112.1 class I SAM-dependent methyltransferase [Gammaproteobacteria bacterium]MDB2661873.1 class I SAM-dependent methyltransferase [Gammaproteobacteria bacterium]MDC0991061.1 class I SAM-dependent methyltransferase [Gammaproteobacteria bacterium]MDC1443295.1 class I SAM-dependent methyltransferase [Gammaproteobacteria bacterium]
MGLYDKYILPKFLNCACGSKPINYQRQKVVPLAKGKVLDIGIGSGLNIPFYNSDKIDKVIGIDPSHELIDLAKELANDSKASIELVIGSAESIPYPDNFFDTVLVTYTMCTIPNVAIANKEMWRVLKDDGRLIFCEHGLAPDKKISKWQNRIDPFWGKIAGGCHLNRDIQKLITDAGFSFESLDKMYIPSTPKFAGYNYWGIGKK